MHLFRTHAALCITALLTGCGGAVQNALPLHAPSASSIVRDRASLTIRIRLPKRHKARLGPQYVSAGTKGMTLAFTGRSRSTTVLGLTPSDPRCVGSPLHCTIEIRLSPGSYAVTIDTFDQAPIGGAIPSGAHLLSSARNVALSVARGKANALAVTLDGVPASFVVGGFPDATAGNAFLAKSFSVTVKDAAGYTIVGTFATPVTLSDSDTSGATAIATTGSHAPPSNELLSSSDAVTISYTGAPIAQATIIASAGSARGSGFFRVRLPLFVADSTVTAIDEIPPGCVSPGCVATNLGGGFNHPSGVAVDASGNVFVADTQNSAVKEVPPGCTSSGCVSTIGGGFSYPEGVAVDASGNVFVSDSGNNVVKKIPSGCITSGCVTTIGSGFSSPDGIAVDGSDNVFVADDGHGAVKELLAADGYDTVKTLGGGFHYPAGVAIDRSGNVFVADNGLLKILEIPPGCGSASCVITLGGTFLFQTHGVAVDTFGNLYDADDTGVYEIPVGCASGTCVTTVAGGFHSPRGVAIFH